MEIAPAKEEAQRAKTRYKSLEDPGTMRESEKQQKTHTKTKHTGTHPDTVESCDAVMLRLGPM